MSSQKKFRVLFVCIGNSCRSPMAESVALRHASDILEPRSAGLYPLGRIAEATIETLRANGYSAEGLTSKPLTRQIFFDSDLIVNLTGEPLDTLYRPASSGPHSGPAIEHWRVADPYGEDQSLYQGVLEEIESRVLLLAARLRSRR